MRTIIISNIYNRASWVALPLCLAAASSLAGQTHDYTVTVDRSLSRLDVVAKFDGTVTDLAARSRRAARFLLEARDCNGERTLTNRGRRLVIPSAGISCLRYSIDLVRAARNERRNAYLHASNVIVSPTVWMWRPRLGGDDVVRVNFDLPDDLRVSVPWQALPGEHNAYRLTASPQSGNAIAIFGRFDTTTTSIAGTSLRIDLLRTRRDVDLATTVDWVREAARNVTLAYGRFPHSAARVVVFPLYSSPWRSDSPVYFGRVIRDGGETVELLIDPDKSHRAFYTDWTATHELSHLMLPYVRRQQRWLSEGFAQYYQNLLLARAGRYSAQEAWQKLYDGFERGRSSVPTLSPNQAAGGGERNSRMKIYWSGAALALMADVELRRRSDGAESLDTVLGQLQRCCLPAQGSWSGRRLLTKLDSFLDEPVFVSLYEQYADTAGFPDVRPLLEQLGVSLDQGTVSFDDDAELAEIRATLTARRYTRSPGKQ